MDYRKTYNEFRDGLINRIIANADEINSKPNIRVLGYHMCVELDEDIELDDGRAAFRVYNDPIFITGVKGIDAIGYSAIDANLPCGSDGYYYLKELSTETLIDLCEIIK